MEKTNKKHKLIVYLRVFVILSGFVAGLFCFNNNPCFYFLPSLPIVFGIFFYCLVPKQIYIGAGFFTMSLVLYIRYIVYPVTLVQDNFESFSFDNLAETGIFLMLFEMTVIFIVIHYWGYRKENKSLIVNKPDSFLPILLGIIALFFIINDSNVFANHHFIWESGKIRDEVITGDSHVSSVVIQLAQFFIVVCFFSLFYIKYQHTNNKVMYYLAVAALFFPCIYYIGHSRLSLFIPVVGLIVYASKAFPSKSKGLITLVIGYGFIALLYLSLQKFFGAESISQVDKVNTSTLLNSYFGGLNNITIGLQTINQYGYHPSLFVIDCFRNAMGIAQYFDIPGSSVLFNMTYYGNSIAADQIPPTIYQGILYFGYLFCFLPTFIMTWFVCKFDGLSAKTTNPYYAYLYITFVVIIGWAIPGAWTHLTARIFNYLLPLVFLLYFNQLVHGVKNLKFFK